MNAPAHPIESGLVMRKARDDNGVAAGAEDAISTASSSSGSALPETLQRKFESSLGSDLSSVRVHTGADSAAAADAVGARAYTMGQDIHFGAGQYDPGSGEGQHLLAHEVAHTVQQSGGPPTRQNKLEVSTPNDPLEHEADRAADAMLSGSAFAISGGNAHAARKIARERKWDWSLGAKPTVGDGFVKFQVDGSAKVEQSMSYVTVSGQMTAGLEAELKMPGATSEGVSMKGATGKDGKTAQTYEAEIPIWKDQAKKAAQEEAEKHWTDHFAPAEASLVFGADLSDKPGVAPANRTVAEQSKAKPGESKESASVGIKVKSKSGDSYTVKIQAFEVAQKTGKGVDVSGPALKANYDKKFKKSMPVKAAGEDATLTFTGNLKPELSFKPNYAAIGEAMANGVARQGAAEAAAVATEALALAGPIAMAAVMIGHGIYIAGEKGARDAAILGAVGDARGAAMVYAQVMFGQPGIGAASGPRCAAAAERGRADLARYAAQSKMSVEDFAAEMRQRSPKDFSLVYGPAEKQAHMSFASWVSGQIAAWRKEHWIQATFTTQADDELAIMKNVDMVWNRH